MDTPTLSHIAHELRTPLALIHSRLQLIEAEQPQIKLQKNWIYLTENIRDMGELISQLTEMSRPLSKDRTILNLHELLLELIDDFLLQGNNDELLLSLESSPEATLVATSFPGNRLSLKQIFTNLIKNALEATEGQFSQIVQISLSITPTHLCIEVWDNGPGISADILPKLYMPYITTKAYGTGIGLSIVKDLIQEQGGLLEAENHDHGAIFRVLLPRP